MGMLMTSTHTMNKRPSVRQTIQPGYNQGLIAKTDIDSVHNVQRVRTRSSMSSMSMNNRYSMSSLYNAPRGSGGG
jgi:hypothetical protein